MWNTFYRTQHVAVPNVECNTDAFNTMLPTSRAACEHVPAMPSHSTQIVCSDDEQTLHMMAQPGAPKVKQTITSTTLTVTYVTGAFWPSSRAGFFFDELAAHKSTRAQTTSRVLSSAWCGRDVNELASAPLLIIHLTGLRRLCQCGCGSRQSAVAATAPWCGKLTQFSCLRRLEPQLTMYILTVSNANDHNVDRDISRQKGIAVWLTKNTVNEVRKMREMLTLARKPPFEVV